MRVSPFVAALAVLVASVLSEARADQLIHAGRLVDGVSDRPRSEVTIRIDEAKIVSVDSGYAAPGEDDQVIDLRNHTLLPGLMDMHTHLSGELTRDSYLQGFTFDPADVAVRAVANARKTLAAGFTTVRDLGDSYTVTVALRDAINAGIVPGPRIHTAATAIATTGGHADPTNNWGSEIARDAGPVGGVVDGPAAARKAVRQRYKEGADLIKITATGGVLSLAKSGRNAQFTDEELAAIIETAKDYDMHVAAHAHGREGMLRAVRAGVHTIEHGTMMDREIMDEMKRRGTWYVPTILAGAWTSEMTAEEGFFPPIVVPKVLEMGRQIEATFAAAHRAGVKIAFGTDSGVSPHGQNAREFVLMVSGGMTPMEALQSATSSAASLLGVDDVLGSVEAGKAADLVAVPGNPLEDIAIMQEVDWVMKDGVVFRER